ncbi:reverse transcriptase domain-containing protein [Tanacetum coccineum]
MPSPNHPTSNIEDSFSSNFLNYLSASPDYFPALPGNTYSSSSNNSFVYHNPYMKVMQAYDAISPPQVTIPLLTILPPSPVLSLSLIFGSRDFIHLEEIPPPKDTETPVESPIPISPSSSVGSPSPVRLLLHLRKIVADSITAALELKLCATMAVTFATGTLTDDALSSWIAYAQPIGINQANRITWIELKRLLTNKYCPRTKVRKMEDELYNLTVKGNDLKPYVRRFQELAVLCPNMVPNTKKLLEAFIGGLPRSIEENVTALKPQTLDEAINIAQRLMDQVTKHTPVKGTNDHKRKFDDERNTTNNNNYPNDHNNNNHSNNHNNNNYQDNRNINNHNNDYHQQQNRRQETIKTYAATPTENKRSLHCQVSDLQQNGSSDQKLQKQRTLGLLD